MPSIRSHIATIFKSFFSHSNRQIRQVHCPKLLYQQLQLGKNHSRKEMIQQIIESIAESTETGQQVQNIIVAIDITCQTDLISEGFAEQLAQSILSVLDQHYPGLRDRFVGISDDEKRLPLHGLLRTGAIAWEEIDNQHLFVFE